MLKGITRSVLGLMTVGLVVLAGAPRAQRQTAIPTPSDFLKIKVGSDGVLASYDQIASYVKAIDALSDRITVEDLGPTTMGHQRDHHVAREHEEAGVLP